MSPSLAWLRAAAVAALAAQSAAQTCYYPNGSAAPDTEKPCSSAEGSACCPDNWQCLDNGLCHYPPNNLYGRYSCTDKDWNSPGCPRNLCTYDMSAFGGESITQCSNHDNNWCCNADAQNVNCCSESPTPRPFFALRDGSAYATIGSSTASAVPTISTITGLATGSGSASSAAPSSAGSRGQSATANAASTTRTPVTSVQASLSSGSAGVATIYITNVITPSADPTAGANNGGSSQNGGGSTNIGLIVGCAVGIPLGLALIGILVWMLRKRRNNKSNPYKETPELDAEASGSAGVAAAKLGKDKKFRHSRPGTAEIDGNPIGASRPISTVPGSAELPSGAGFQPGHGTAFAPDGVGIGGGNTDRTTWDSVPPQYSPAHAQNAFPTHAFEMDGTSAMPVINEKEQYQADRQPQTAAELPTVKTPPEDAEKQLTK
ncbi:hypothetical protein ACN47E_002205 [Coniothyrium glycines]